MLHNLKQLRKERGISQQRLADAIGVSQPSINKYENHNIEPEIEVLKRMADYFDTSIDYIVGHTDVRRKIEPTEDFRLNHQEAEMISRLRALNDDEKRCINLTMQAFLKKNVNETRLTQNIATPIILLGTFHFGQLPLLRISQGKNQEPSTSASTFA